MRVLEIVLGVVAINALVWVPILFWSRKRIGRRVEAIREMVVGTRERLVMEPEAAQFATAREGSLGVARTTAVVALTGRRLVVRPLIGRGADVPLDQIGGVSTNKWFHGSYRNGRTHVILKLPEGREIAFAPADPERWVAALPRR